MAKKMTVDECIELGGDSPLLRELMSWKLGHVGYASARLAKAIGYNLDEPTISEWIKNETIMVASHVNEMAGNDRNVGIAAMRAIALTGCIAVNLSMTVMASLKESADLYDLNKDLDKRKRF